MPALVREHPELAAKLYGDVLEKEESIEEQPKGEEEGDDEEPKVDASKLEPWTMEQRLAAFYAKYEPTKGTKRIWEYDHATHCCSKSLF